MIFLQSLVGLDELLFEIDFVTKTNDTKSRRLDLSGVTFIRRNMFPTAKILNMSRTVECNQICKISVREVYVNLRTLLNQ